MKNQKTLEYRTDEILSNTYTLVASFHPNIPEYVHRNVSVSDLYALANDKDADPYLMSAPEGYAEYLLENFPDLVRVDYPEEFTVEAMERFEAENITPVDLTDIMSEIHCWAKQTLIVLVDLMREGTVKVTVDPTEAPPVFDLYTTLH